MPQRPKRPYCSHEAATHVSSGAAPVLVAGGVFPIDSRVALQCDNLADPLQCSSTTADPHGVCCSNYQPHSMLSTASARRFA